MQSAHEKILELLPWYINGTLKASERETVERHLQACLPCHAALKQEQRMQGLVQAQENVPIGPEHGIADLVRRIDRDRTPKRRRANQRTPLIAYGVAAALAGLLAWLVFLSPNSQLDQQGQAGFSTLSSGGETSGLRIDIVFSDGLSSADIDAIIDGIRGERISGPSELGRYTIAIPARSENERDELLTRLRDDSRIRFVGQAYIDATPGGEEGQ
jgi:hypothetical protein